MKNKSKVLVKSFQGFVLGWCQNVHILFKNYESSKGLCHLGLGILAMQTFLCSVMILHAQ
jgi:hypothetical protein